MRINIIDSDNIPAYLIRSLIRSIYKDVMIVTKPSTSDCDLLIISQKDIGNTKLNMNKVLLYTKDFNSPLRSKNLLSIIKDRSLKFLNKEDICVEAIRTIGLDAISKPKP